MPEASVQHPATEGKEGSAAKRVELALRDAILSMRLLPGARLSEQELAQSCGLSRQPVREALIALAAFGLVEVQPQRGTFVTRLSVRKMMQARFVREAIEVAVVRKACERFQPDARADIEEIILLQARSAGRGDHSAFHRQDEAFHAALAAGAGCELSWQAVKSTKYHMDRICVLTLPKAGAMLHLVRQHEAIVAAIDAGNPGGAQRALEEHMTGILRALPSIVERSPELFEDMSCGICPVDHL